MTELLKEAFAVESGELAVYLDIAESYARTAELTAYLEACKAKCGHCAGTSHSLPDIVDPEPYFRPAGYVCNFGDLPDSYVHKTNWIECVPCAATEIRSLTRFAELNKEAEAKDGSLMPARTIKS